MTSSPKRPWFRFHLLTAVLMTLIAGVLLRANVIRNNAPAEPARAGFNSEYEYRLALIDFTFGTPSNQDYGWPSTALRIVPAFVVLHRDDDPGPNPWPLPNRTWLWKGLAINVLSGLAITMIAALAVEWLIRRREGRKP